MRSYANWRLLETVKKISFFRRFPWRSRAFNLLYPNISMHFLHTVLYTFPEVLTRRICFKNQELYKLVIIFLIPVTLVFDSGVTM